MLIAASPWEKVLVLLSSGLSFDWTATTRIALQKWWVAQRNPWLPVVRWFASVPSSSGTGRHSGAVRRLALLQVEQERVKAT